MACYQIVNDFKIDLAARKKLGQGSQGSVYPGISLITNDDVAAKRTEGVYKEFFNKEEFEKEADLLLNRIPPHENIIKVYDFTKTEYVSKEIPMLDLWLISELCELGNLKEFAFTHDLSIEQKIDIMYQSALAVRHLHGCKPESIAHRDVKPENILVTGSEDNPIIKLCDFGSAKSVIREGAKSVAMRSLAGTRRYQAPEQFELDGGQFKYDKQVDIFSLGITFLALLNAVKGSLMSPETINEKGLGEIMWKKHKQKQDFTFTVHKSSDSAMVGAVKNVIEKMIRFEPSSRLRAADVVEELRKLIRGYPESQPATHYQSAVTTNTQSAPATGMPSIPDADTISAPATAHQPTPAIDSDVDPATSQPAPNSGTWLSGTEVVAQYDFETVSEEELTFKKGDVLTISGETEYSNCYQATDKSGKVGIIPQSFVRRRRRKRRAVQLHPMPWYHGKIPWKHAYALLIGVEIPEPMAATDMKKLSSNKDEGTFLIFVDSDGIEFSAHEYTLLVVSSDKTVGHYCIISQHGKLTIDVEYFFEDLPQLVQHYQRGASGHCTNLQKPLVYNGPLNMYAHSNDFLKEGWSINQSEIHIGDKCFTGAFTHVHIGSYFGENIYAMKRIDNNPSSVHDALIEAAIMSGLSHKNVVQLIGVVLGEETLIVKEYLDKGRLSDYLLARGPDTMSSHDQFNIARDICQGMQYLEQNNIVHDNLMAQSILLSKDGTAKIGDFHLAHHVEQSIRFDMIRVRWTAPEVFSKDRSTTKADMWSFGIVVWEIYSFGCKPYAEMSNSDVYTHVVKGGRLDAPKRCPDAMYCVMLTAWDIDPAKRPSFAELCNILDRLSIEMNATQ